MPGHDSYDDAHLRAVLDSVRSVAIIGASPRPVKASHMVAKYLKKHGYVIHPVNPNAAGQTLFGDRIHASLADLPAVPDMVDIFRNSEAAAASVDEAIAIGARVVWMQLGVRNDTAAARAEAAGLTVIMNRCPKIELGRLTGEIQWNGFNSGILSARKPALRRATPARKATPADRG